MTSREVEILLVEDNPSDVEVTLRVFRKHNLSNRIQVARDGEEALDFLLCRGEFEHRDRHDTPKVILLDLKLPKVDGLEVLAAIRADEVLRTVPVVVLTSSREERDIVASYEVGATSFIVKPVDFQQFSDVVQHIGYYWLLLNEPPLAGELLVVIVDRKREE